MSGGGHSGGRYFGRNELPPELASKILERDGEQGIGLAKIEQEMTRRRAFSRDYDRAEREALDVLGEEGDEVSQAASKCRRFGVSCNPFTGRSGGEDLSTEIGQLLAAIDLAEYHELIDMTLVAEAYLKKRAEYQQGAAGHVLRHARLGLSEPPFVFGAEFTRAMGGGQ